MQTHDGDVKGADDDSGSDHDAGTSAAAAASVAGSKRKRSHTHAHTEKEPRITDSGTTKRARTGKVRPNTGK